jgi:hypothetical protein
MQDFKELLRQKDELKELWSYFGIEAPFPDKEIRRWLWEHGMEQVQAAVELLSEREHDVKDAVKYLGKVLYNSKLQNMTVEERQEKIKALAALAGKVRAAKEHAAKAAAIKQEFAAVCKDLPRIADSSLKSAGNPLYSAEVRSVPLTSALGVDVGVGSGVDSGVDSDPGGDTGTVQEKSKPAPPAAVSSRPPQASEQTKPQTIQPSEQTKKPWEPRRCPTGHAIWSRGKPHYCGTPPNCIHCGAKEWNHDCKGENVKTNGASASQAKNGKGKPEERCIDCGGLMGPGHDCDLEDAPVACANYADLDL